MSPLAIKLAIGVMVLILINAGVFGWTKYAEHMGAVKQLQKDLVETQKESTRRLDVIYTLKQENEAVIAQNRQRESKDAELRKRLARAAHARDACLDADSVRMLDSIGRRQGPDGAAGSGTPRGAH